MPPRRTIKASELSGLFIYQDPKRGPVFYDIFTRNGYILTSSDVRIYSIYAAMLPMCLIVSLAMVSLFGLPYTNALIVFAAMMILSEIFFRIFFFYKLPMIENYKRPKKDNIVVSFAKDYSRTRLYILIFLLAALSVLMPYYAYMEGMSGFNLYAAWGVGIICFAGVIVSILALIVKARNNY